MNATLTIQNNTQLGTLTLDNGTTITLGTLPTEKIWQLAYNSHSAVRNSHVTLIGGTLSSINKIITTATKPTNSTYIKESENITYTDALRTQNSPEQLDNVRL
jgi:hypothetical protein